MSDIVAFLRAWIAEDAAAARVCPPWLWRQNSDDPDEVLAADDIAVTDAFALSSRQVRATAMHIGRWDPVRVLAEVEAKRRVLDLCAAIIDTEIGRVGVESHDLAFGILDALAMPAADHPDFDPAWRAVTSPVQPHQDPGDTPPDLKS